MKYKVETIVLMSTSIQECKIDGGMPMLIPVYETLDIPDNAIGISVNEELVSMVPVGAPKPFPGTEAAFFKKHMRGICRISYLIPQN